MNILWQKLGVLAFWLCWPLLWVYLKMGRRTRVIVHHEGQVLLVKGWLGAGDWMLPGGGVLRKETSESGAVRELHEETGLYVREEDLEKMIEGTISEHGIKVSYILFSARLKKQEPIRHRRLELVGADWFRVSEIQARADVSKATKYLLARWKDNT